jgi:3-(3-hydroxy-phenyl)propionate hydroxylase
VLQYSELNTPEAEPFNTQVVLGSVALDAPVRLLDGRDSWFLNQLSAGFTLVVFEAEFKIAETGYPCDVLHVQSASSKVNAKLRNTVIDSDGLIQKRYDMLPGTVYLLRPDQHVCARLREVSTDRVKRAINHALAME